MEATTTIRKGSRLGSGSFGHVFRAVQSNTQHVVAVKQSRASLLLKRPLLQHEAGVLRILAGHLRIPEVYAYGRIEHFELMSMQLLHRSLRDVVQEGGSLRVKQVADVACQMLDALKHIHSHRLVHRDIKPDNIMLRSSEGWNICVIDFGLTRPLPNSKAPIAPTHNNSELNSDKPAHVLGTLPFASLNAHKKGSQLTFRDDLESLAYSLLWLLRGTLPWSNYAKCGTRVGRIRQVLAQKKRNTGATLGAGLPVEFGEFVDYTRFLSFNEEPGYEEWRRRFNQVDEATLNSDMSVLERRDSRASTAQPEPPAEAGQIVLIRLDPSITADGYTIREGHESSFIPDPIFNGPEWSTEYRPAVITQVEWDKDIQKYSLLAVAIARKSTEDQSMTIPVIPITTIGSSISGASPKVCVEPAWPLEDSYCYAFKRPMRFHCLPSQERVHSVWQITNSDCDVLLNELSPSTDSLSGSQRRQDLKSTDPDIRHDARLRDREGYCNLYVHVRPLTPAYLYEDSIDWFSKRAWFDECVKAARFQNMNNGIWWTGAWFPAVYQPKEGELSDSYSEPDYSMWEAQDERRKSITLGDGYYDVGSKGEVLAGLTKIIGLEQESEASTA